MLERFIIRVKIWRLSTKIKSMEGLIFRYRVDMELKNQIYYCGSGDVDIYIEEMCHMLYIKISACHRLLTRYEKMLDKLNGVVGQDSSGKN